MADDATIDLELRIKRSEAAIKKLDRQLDGLGRKAGGVDVGRGPGRGPGPSGPGVGSIAGGAGLAIGGAQLAQVLTNAIKTGLTEVGFTQENIARSIAPGAIAAIDKVKAGGTAAEQTIATFAPAIEAGIPVPRDVVLDNYQYNLQRTDRLIDFSADVRQIGAQEELSRGSGLVRRTADAIDVPAYITPIPLYLRLLSEAMDRLAGTRARQAR